MRIILDNVEKSDLQQLKSYLAAVFPDVSVEECLKKDEPTDIYVTFGNTCRVFRKLREVRAGVWEMQTAGEIDSFCVGEPLAKARMFTAGGKDAVWVGITDAGKWIPYREGKVITKAEYDKLK